jgi:hypothetical protein
MTTQTTSYAVTDAERPLSVGETPAAWGDVVRSVDPGEAHDAASMVAAAGLDWSVEQHPPRAKSPNPSPPKSEGKIVQREGTLARARRSAGGTMSRRASLSFKRSLFERRRRTSYHSYQASVNGSRSRTLSRPEPRV